MFGRVGSRVLVLVGIGLRIVTWWRIVVIPTSNNLYLLFLLISHFTSIKCHNVITRIFNPSYLSLSRFLSDRLQPIDLLPVLLYLCLQ
jgi:hypothetical protein